MLIFSSIKIIFLFRKTDSTGIQKATKRQKFSFLRTTPILYNICSLFILKNCFLKFTIKVGLLKQNRSRFSFKMQNFHCIVT
ncbi:hypothetical protein BpHYR1_041910 [Brachionus plicatilis]|uniref:Uncharacterized protein n=1 Tax=Brachionus plicatilis TaxID=10195 RepID=A0A3M7S1A9_BRAPC|nr:hypothetical protein BpHYR1_041910 [Brachionus plicatilis]